MDQNQPGGAGGSGPSRASGPARLPDHDQPLLPEPPTSEPSSSQPLLPLSFPSQPPSSPSSPARPELARPELARPELARPGWARPGWAPQGDPEEDAAGEADAFRRADSF